MLFNSFPFLLFFPITALLYYLIPNKLRWEYLLLVSYGFYMNWNPSYALLLLFVTIVSYIVSISISKSKEKKTKRFTNDRYYILYSTLNNIQVLKLYQRFYIYNT